MSEMTFYRLPRHDRWHLRTANNTGRCSTSLKLPDCEELEVRVAKDMTQCELNNLCHGCMTKPNENTYKMALAKRTTYTRRYTCPHCKIDGKPVDMYYSRRSTVWRCRVCTRRYKDTVDGELIQEKW